METERAKAIASLVRSGRSYLAVAKMLGISKATVGRAARQIHGAGPSHSPLSEPEIDDAVALYSECRSTLKVAVILNRSRLTIARAITSRGFAMQGPKGRTAKRYVPPKEAGYWSVGAWDAAKKGYRCTCVCGQARTIPSVYLKSGKQRKSCGCKKGELLSKALAGRSKPYQVRQFTAAEWETMIAAYTGGSSLKKTAAIYDTHYGIVRKELRRRGIALREHNDRLYHATVDETRFANPTTEEEAYWLGLLAADGNMAMNRPGVWRVSLGLQAGDYPHVSAFAKFLGATRRPYFRTRSFPRCDGTYGHMAIYAASSPVLYQNLLAQGLHPNKTWTVQPWRGPEHLLRHYWRGCIDGDGWVCYRPFSSRIGFCGNEAMVRGFEQYVRDRTGLAARIRFQEPTGQRALALGYKFAVANWSGTLACRPVVHLLYEGATTVLWRKKMAAELILTRPVGANGPPDRKRAQGVTLAALRSLYLELGSWEKVCVQLRIGPSTLYRVFKRLGNPYAS